MGLIRQPPLADLFAYPNMHLFRLETSDSTLDQLITELFLQLRYQRRW